MNLPTEANIPNSLTAEELARLLNEQFMAGDINSCVVQTHYESQPLEISEIWCSAGVLHISVRADAPPK